MTSRRVIVAGVGPVPPREPEKLHAPGLRLWAFADHLERRGHRVILCEAMFEGAEAAPAEELFAGRNITHRALPLDRDGAAARLREICAAERAEALVASTDIINAAAALARLPVPIWLDFNGHPMTERQMLAAVHGSDEGLIDQWRYVVPSLLGGDRFSVCCRAQRGALVGELGAVGRLNRFTAAVDLVHVVYPGVAAVPPEGEPGTIRGPLTPGDATVLLHTGGYNTWMDAGTLFAGLERAMAAVPSLHYVSVGGAIAGHDEKTFGEFKAMAEGSERRERFHFKGYVPWPRLADFYREADLAINIDLPTYEGVFGWRNRIIEWAVAGVPIATTTVSELAEDLAARDLAAPFDCGDAEGLAGVFVQCVKSKEAFRARAARAREYVTSRYDYAKLIEPIAAWVETPEASPDLPAPERRPEVTGLIRPANSLAETAASALAGPPTPHVLHRSGFRARLRRILG